MLRKGIGYLGVIIALTVADGSTVLGSTSVEASLEVPAAPSTANTPAPSLPEGISSCLDKLAYVHQKRPLHLTGEFVENCLTILNVLGRNPTPAVGTEASPSASPNDLPKALAFFLEVLSEVKIVYLYPNSSPHYTQLIPLFPNMRVIRIEPSDAYDSLLTTSLAPFINAISPACHTLIFEHETMDPCFDTAVTPALFARFTALKEFCAPLKGVDASFLSVLPSTLEILRISNMRYRLNNAPPQPRIEREGFSELRLALEAVNASTQGGLSLLKKEKQPVYSPAPMPGFAPKEMGAYKPAGPALSMSSALPLPAHNDVLEKKPARSAPQANRFQALSATLSRCTPEEWSHSRPISLPIQPMAPTLAQLNGGVNRFIPADGVLLNRFPNLRMLEIAGFDRLTASAFLQNLNPNAESVDISRIEFESVDASLMDRFTNLRRLKIYGYDLSLAEKFLLSTRSKQPLLVCIDPGILSGVQLNPIYKENNIMFQPRA